MGEVGLVIGGALLVSAGLVVVQVLRRPPADPRTSWTIRAPIPVWFEHASSGAHYMANGGDGQRVVGAAGDIPVPGTRPQHARIRVFARDQIDITPIAAAPVRIAGRRIRGPAWLCEGDRVTLAGVDLIAHIGWSPDPTDPRIGTLVAGERLWERRGEGRYTTPRHVVELLDPPVDPAAHEHRLRAAQSFVRALRPVLRVQPDAIVVDALEYAPRTGPLTPGEFITVCGLVAPLHEAGIAHGKLADAVLATPGALHLWPVAPTGSIADDLEALRLLLPEAWPTLPGADARALLRAALRHGLTIDAFPFWDLGPCVRCGDPFARAAPPRTTMFDGRDPTTGRSFGGRTTEHRSECLACGHIEVRIEREAYR